MAGGVSWLLSSCHISNHASLHQMKRMLPSDLKHPHKQYPAHEILQIVMGCGANHAPPGTPPDPELIEAIKKSSPEQIARAFMSVEDDYASRIIKGIEAISEAMSKGESNPLLSYDVTMKLEEKTKEVSKQFASGEITGKKGQQILCEYRDKLIEKEKNQMSDDSTSISE